MESRLGAPLLAQDASYLAASARISSLSVNSMVRLDILCLYTVYQGMRLALS